MTHGSATYALAAERQEGGFWNWFKAGMRDVLEAHGYRGRPEDAQGADWVFYRLDPDRPRYFRRRARATYVAGVAESRRLPAPETGSADGAFSSAAPAGRIPAEWILKEAYPLLVRAVVNLAIFVLPDEARSTYFVTPEQGCYYVGAASEGEAYFRRIFERMAPLANARLVIDNLFEPDLPRSLWDGDEKTESLRRAGKRLDAWNLLPSPVPIDQMLDPGGLRHLRRLFGLGGLSYGNLSARRDGDEFWMSASGVDKSRLERIGEHILLVRRFEPQREAMILSVPPHVRPRRVSVDAIEHWMIYRRFPGVGAIIHVHGWMQGVEATEIGYPCGTLELAQSVVACLERAPDPNRAVVGLRNHGLTITGTSIDEILERVEGRIERQVPMT